MRGYWIVVLCVLAGACTPHTDNDGHSDESPVPSGTTPQPSPSPTSQPLDITSGIYEVSGASITKNSCAYDYDVDTLNGQMMEIAAAGNLVVIEGYEDGPMTRNDLEMAGEMTEEETLILPGFNCTYIYDYTLTGVITDVNTLEWSVDIHKDGELGDTYQCEEIVSDTPLPCDFDRTMTLTLVE